MSTQRALASDEAVMIHMGPVETIMDFMHRRAPLIQEVNHEKVRRLMVEREFRLLAGRVFSSGKKRKRDAVDGIEFPYTKTQDFKHCLVRLVSEALPYLEALGLVVFRVQCDLSEWVAQHARRSLADMHNFFPIRVEPLTASRGQLVYMDYGRSSDGGRDSWHYVPLDKRRTGFVYLVYLNPIWGSERMCAVRLLLMDVPIGVETLVAWDNIPSVKASQRISGREPTTLWSPFWHLYRMHFEIEEVRRNRLASDHELSWSHTTFRAVPPADSSPAEHTSAEILGAAPQGSLPQAQQVEALQKALMLHRMAVVALEKTYGTQGTRRGTMATMYERPRPNESWSVLPPFVEIAHRDAPSSVLDLDQMEQRFRERVASLMGWKELMGGGGKAQAGKAKGKGKAAAVEAEEAESKSLMHEERQMISAMVGRMYAATFSFIDLVGLAHVLDLFSEGEREEVGNVLRLRTGPARGATSRFKDVVLGLPLVHKPDEPENEPSLRQIIAQRLVTADYLEARLVFSQDDDEEAEAEQEASKLPHQRQPPEQQEQSLNQFDRLKDLLLGDAIDPDDVKRFGKDRLDLDLRTLRRPPPPPVAASAKKKPKKKARKQ